MQGPIATQIQTLLTEALSPVFLQIINESDLHHGPKGRESHFKVHVVSDVFQGLSRLERQRKVFALLDEVMPQIHALTLRAQSLAEAEASDSNDFQSPPCGGRRG